VLIFGLKTSKLLAEETFVTYTKTEKTSLTSWTVYLRSGVVDSITSTTPASGNPGRPLCLMVHSPASKHDPAARPPEPGGTHGARGRAPKQMPPTV
jgi:hypothetical protein